MERGALLRELAGAIVRVGRPHPVRVGIDGVDGAGKTTAADELVALVRDQGRPVIRASVDSFHHPKRVRHRRGRSSPEGYYYDSFQYGAIRRCLLEPLGPGGSLCYTTAVFDHRVDAAVDEPFRTAENDAILLMDGVFLHRPELREHWDLSVFLHVPFEVSVARMAARDDGPEAPGAAANQRYVEGQRLYLRRCRPHEAASVVIDNSDLTRPCVLRGLGVDSRTGSET